MESAQNVGRGSKNATHKNQKKKVFSTFSLTLFSLAIVFVFLSALVLWRVFPFSLVHCAGSTYTLWKFLRRFQGLVSCSSVYSKWSSSVDFFRMKKMKKKEKARWFRNTTTTISQLIACNLCKWKHVDFYFSRHENAKKWIFARWKLFAAGEKKPPPVKCKKTKELKRRKVFKKKKTHTTWTTSKLYDGISLTHSGSIHLHICNHRI